MKRLAIFLSAAAIALVASCGGGPKQSEAEKLVNDAAKAVVKGDYKAYVNTFDLSDEDKAQLQSMVEQKVKPEIESHQGIKSYEVVETSIDEEAGTGKAKVVFNYGDGTSDDSTINLVKKDGKWLQVFSK